MIECCIVNEYGRPQIPVKIFLSKDAKQYGVPTRGTSGASCVDLRYVGKEPIVLELGKQHQAVLPTGIFLEIPPGYEGQVRPRGGTSKKGLTISLGTIDSDYRGEICMFARYNNIGKLTINPGDRIGQLAIVEVPNWVFDEVESVEDFSNTDRCDGRFHSTGLK